MHEIILQVVEVVSVLGYLGIIIMMLLESSFFPFPSEVVIIPAGYLAFQGEMNIYLVIFFGILGSLLGSYLNHLLYQTPKVTSETSPILFGEIH